MLWYFNITDEPQAALNSMYFLTQQIKTEMHFFFFYPKS